MSNQGLHLRAAESYDKASWKSLRDDSSRDAFIVREAGEIWRSKRMRKKVNAAVAEVRCEVHAKRLAWTPKDIC